MVLLFSQRSLGLNSSGRCPYYHFFFFKFCLLSLEWALNPSPEKILIDKCFFQLLLFMLFYLDIVQSFVPIQNVIRTQG